MSDFVQLATPWLFHDNNASSFPHELLQCVSSMKNLHVDLLRASELTFATFKVEKILKGSLDLIPSPSMKIQIMGGKVGLRCKGKTLLGVVNKLCWTKSLLTMPSNVWPKN